MLPAPNRGPENPSVLIPSTSSIPQGLSISLLLLVGLVEGPLASPVTLGVPRHAPGPELPCQGRVGNQGWPWVFPCQRSWAEHHQGRVYALVLGQEEKALKFS